MMNKKDNIKLQIENVLGNKMFILQDAYSKSLEQLVEELKIYQYELEFQNEELLRIQAELEESRNDFRQLFENAPINYVVLNEEFNIVEYNKTFQKMVSLVDNSEGRLDFRKFIHPDSQDKFYFFLKEILETKIPKQIDTMVLTPEDQTYHVTIFGNVFARGYNSCYIRLGIVDITKSVLAEKALLKSEEKWRTLNATKDKFFSIIAHDLKSPLSSIISFSDVLKSDAKDLDINSIIQYAGVINSSAKHTFELLVNLLDWAIMQQGEIPFHPKAVLLNQVVHNELSGLINMASHKGIVLINELHANIVLNIDENMLGAVLRNLIINAIKYTPKNGQVRVAAWVYASEIQVSVVDNGIGMTSDAVDKLFKIETSFSTRGTENEKGTGLGLLLCKEFVEKNGGRIWAESEPGKGSRFCFSFPKQETSN